MNPTIYLVCALLLLIALYPVMHAMWRTYFRLRRTTVVMCPETQIPATVEPNAIRAALMLLLGAQTIRLKTCSLWPERCDCRQACVSQLGEPHEPGMLV